MRRLRPPVPKEPCPTGEMATRSSLISGHPLLRWAHISLLRKMDSASIFRKREIGAHLSRGCPEIKEDRVAISPVGHGSLGTGGRRRRIYSNNCGKSGGTYR